MNELPWDSVGPPDSAVDVAPGEASAKGGRPDPCRRSPGDSPGPRGRPTALRKADRAWRRRASPATAAQSRFYDEGRSSSSEDLTSRHDSFALTGSGGSGARNWGAALCREPVLPRRCFSGGRSPRRGREPRGCWARPPCPVIRPPWRQRICSRSLSPCVFSCGQRLSEKKGEGGEEEEGAGEGGGG